MNEILHQLFERLNAIGIGTESVAGLKRDVANCLNIDAGMSLSEVNRRLRYLGWGESQLDYHTYQLLVAWIEAQDGMLPPAREELPARVTPPTSQAHA